LSVPRHRLPCADEIEIPTKVLAPEARVVPPVIVGREDLEGPDASGDAVELFLGVSLPLKRR
jgi:hypothetical protein